MRSLLACTLLALAVGESAARAAQLQRLHVISITLASDTRTPSIDQPFHLRIFVHVQDRTAELDNLVLPNLSGLEVSGGDRKHVVAGARGTNYSESIGVVAHHSGPMAIAPAYLEAIDARDGKAKRFFSNDLNLDVLGAQTTISDANLTASIINMLVSVLGWMLGLTVAIAVVTLVFLRPRGSRVPRPALPPPTQTDPRDVLRNAAAALQAAPTRANALRVREAAWSLAGASEGETLADILRRPAALNPALRAALEGAERAAFTHDGDLKAAIGDLLKTLEHLLA